VHHCCTGDPSLLSLLDFLGNLLNGMKDVFNGLRRLGLSQNLLENVDGLLGGVLLQEGSNNLVRSMGGLEGVGMSVISHSSVMPNDGSVSSDSSNVPNSADDLVSSSDESVVSSHNVTMFGKTVSFHHREQFVDHSVVVSGGMSNDRVELVHKSVVSDDGVDLVPSHLHITF